jgi:hypothetical protein
VTNKENAAALITDWVLRELQPTACIAELSAFLEQQANPGGSIAHTMTADPVCAYNNCLLRGREIALGQEEPSISTGKEALLEL